MAVPLAADGGPASEIRPSPAVGGRPPRTRRRRRAFEGLTLVAASTPDGRTAQVRLRAVARPTLLSWITAPWSDGVVLDVTASARGG